MNGFPLRWKAISGYLEVILNIYNEKNAKHLGFTSWFFLKFHAVILPDDYLKVSKLKWWFPSTHCSLFDERVCPTRKSWKETQSSWLIRLQTYCRYSRTGWEFTVHGQERHSFNTDPQLWTWKRNSKGDPDLLCFPSQPQESDVYLLAERGRPHFIWLWPLAWGRVTFPSDDGLQIVLC